MPGWIAWNSSPHGPSCLVIILTSFAPIVLPATTAQTSDNSIALHGVVINEVYARPPDPRAPLRFVELFNAGMETVDLSGWRLVGDAVFEIPMHSYLSPGRFLVLAEDPRFLRKERKDSLLGFQVLGPVRQTLSGENDYLRLVDAKGHEVDIWSITSFPPWPMEIVGQGASLERIRAAAGSLDPSNWRASRVPAGGTPGRPNSVSAESLPPFVWDMTLHPANPDPLEQVTVQALIVGDENTTTASLRVRVENTPFAYPLNIAPTDESGPIATLGGRPLHRWEGTIPGLTTGTVGLVTIDACDFQNGTCRPWPDYPQWHSEGFVAGDFTTTPTLLAQWRYKIDWNRWRLLVDNPFTEGLAVPAGVFSGNHFYPHTWIRLRGRSSRFYPKKSFRLTLTGKRTLLDGRETLYLKSEWSDPSLIRERLAWRVEGCVGLPIVQVSPALLWVNDWYYGVMNDVELPSRRWMRRLGFDPEGLLVRVDFGLFPLSGLPALLSTVFSSVGDDTANLAAYDDMAFRFVDVKPENATPVIRDTLNVPLLIDLLLAQALLADRDVRFINRVYYRPPLRSPSEPAEWEILPWDLDLTFGRYPGPREGIRDLDLPTDTPPLDLRAMNDIVFAGADLSLEFRERFYQRIEGAVGTCFLDTHLEPQIRDWSEQLGEWGRRDREQWAPEGVPGEWNEQPRVLLDWINLRRHFLLRWDRPQYYRSPVENLDDLISPPEIPVRGAEGIWRSLSPEWKRTFPVADFLRNGRWPALPLWAEVPTALHHAANRLLPPLPLLGKIPPGSNSPDRFEPARAVSLVFLLLLLPRLLHRRIRTTTTPNNLANDRTVSLHAENRMDDKWDSALSTAKKGAVAGILWVAGATALSRAWPNAAPRPLPADWWTQPAALAAWMAATTMWGPGASRRPWIRIPLALLLGAGFFAGIFSPVAISVFHPGSPWIPALGVGIGMYIFVSREGVPRSITKKLLGAGVIVLATVAVFGWTGRDRLRALGIPTEIYAVAGGVLGAVLTAGNARARALSSGLLTLVTWHLAGDHLAFLWTARDAATGAQSDLPHLWISLDIEARLWIPAVATSLFVMIPALLWQPKRKGHPSRMGSLVRRTLAAAWITYLSAAILASLSWTSTASVIAMPRSGASEAEFERLVREGVLVHPPGFLRRTEAAFDTWYSHLTTLDTVPSRRPLLAAAVMGKSGSRDAGRYAHTLLLHRHPWMLGEALAAHWAMGRPITPDDAQWLLRRLDKGILDIDFPHSRQFERCLARRLRAQVKALEGV